MKDTPGDKPVKKTATLSIGKKPVELTLDGIELSWTIKGKPAGIISIRQKLTVVELSTTSSTQFTVGPDVKGHFFTFDCAGKDDVVLWTNAIKESMKSAPDANPKADKLGWFKSKGKMRFYELKEGVLVWYQQQQDDSVKIAKNFKGQLMLNGCEISSGDKPNTIVITDGKTKTIMTSEVGSPIKPWVAALKKNVKAAEESGVGVNKGKKREQLSVGAKIKKGLAQKVGTSKSGKNLIKKLFNAEVMDLLASLRKVIEAFTNVKKAEEIENNIIKIITKLYFLVDGEKVPLEEFLKADKPLRQALKLLSEAWGQWSSNRRRKKGWLNDNFKMVSKHLGDVEKLLVRLMSPFIRPKNVVRIQYTLAFIGNPEFLSFVAKNDKLEEDRLELELAMDGYTAIEINPD